jgi:hypothetical protein
MPNKIKLVYKNIPINVSYKYQSGGKESIVVVNQRNWTLYKPKTFSL